MPGAKVACENSHDVAYLSPTRLELGFAVAITLEARLCPLVGADVVRFRSRCVGNQESQSLSLLPGASRALELLKLCLSNALSKAVASKI